MAGETTAERPTLVRFKRSQTLHIAADSERRAECHTPCTTACGLTKTPAFVSFADALAPAALDRLCSNCVSRWGFSEAVSVGG